MKPSLRLPLICVAVLAGPVLAGCGGGGSTSGQTAAMPACLAPKAPVALAIGVRSNSAQPILTNSVKDATNSAINANLAVSIIRLDGDPKVVFSQAFRPSGANNQARKSEYNAYIGTVNGILAGTAQPSTDIRAHAPEVNILQGLSIAAGEVPPGGNVIVMDSGLQTTSPLNFATGLLNDDPQTIVSFLKNANPSELPDLSGRHVEFIGLGWTASPQPGLSIAYRTKVQEIWQDIASAAGASCVAVDPTPDTNSGLSGLPLVTVVTPPPTPEPPVRCSVTNLDDANNVGFDYDSTQFRNPSGARATLGKLANVILGARESVMLTGSTSSEGSDAHNQWLSLQRAIAVKNILVELGVPASRIAAKGDGSHLPGRLNDTGPNGQLLIGPAIQNRKVVAKLTGAGCP